MPNPFESGSPGIATASSNPFENSAAPAAPTSPADTTNEAFAAGAPIKGSLITPLLNLEKKRAKTVLPIAAKNITAISGALNYPISHTTLPLITGKKTYEEQMPVYRKKLGLEGFYNYNPPNIHTGVDLIDRPVNAAQGFASGLANNLMDAAITTPIDPLTAVPSLGELKRTPVGAVAKAAVNKLAQSYPGQVALGATMWGGKAAVKRAVAEHGGDIGKAVEDIETAQGAGHAGTAEGQRWEAMIKRRTNQIVNGINPSTGVKIPGAALSKAEQENVQHALNGEELPVTKVGGEEFPTALSPKEQAAVRQLHTLEELDFKMRSRAAASRGMGGDFMRYREKYYPFQHQVEEKSRPGYTMNPATGLDTRNLERPDLTISKNAKTIQEDFASMGGNLGRQVETKFLNDSVGSMLNDPEIENLFKQEIEATGEHADLWGKAKPVIRAIVGWPRAALIGISPGHAANEVAAALGTVPLHLQPKFWAETAVLAKKLFMAQAKGDDKEFFRLTEPGRRMGAGVGSFAERQAFYQRLPQWLGLPWWSKSMSNLVWSISGAIRQNYAKMLLETGEAKSPLQAGGMAQRRLVDYQYRTPIQNFARHIAPFGTYAGGIPGAVLGGITRDIPRAAALNRMTQGAFYGSKPGPNQPGYESFTPEAQVGRLFNYVPGKKYTESGPGDFVRSHLSIPIVAGLDLAQDILQTNQRPGHWASYGEAWMPQRNKKTGKWDLGYLVNSAIAGVPEAQAALESQGIGPFQWNGIAEELQRQFTRTQYTPPKPGLAPPPIAPTPAGGNPFQP